MSDNQAHTESARAHLLKAPQMFSELKQTKFQKFPAFPNTVT